MAAVRQIAVTGGGTGIGKAIAGAVAQDGNVVVITGRRPEPTAAAVASHSTGQLIHVFPEAEEFWSLPPAPPRRPRPIARRIPPVRIASTRRPDHRRATRLGQEAVSCYRRDLGGDAQPVLQPGEPSVHSRPGHAVCQRNIEMPRTGHGRRELHGCRKHAEFRR